VLRKVTNSGFTFGQFNNLESSSAVPGMSSMFAPDNSNDQYFAEDHIVQGNCLIVANNASSEFKLKYSLINHSHGQPIEQMFIATIE
jgi:hypothetical protein